MHDMGCLIVTRSDTERYYGCETGLTSVEASPKPSLAPHWAELVIPVASSSAPARVTLSTLDAIASMKRHRHRTRHAAALAKTPDNVFVGLVGEMDAEVDAVAFSGESAASAASHALPIPTCSPQRLRDEPTATTEESRAAPVAPAGGVSRTDGAGAPIESVPGQRMSASSGAYSVADMLRDAMDAMCVGEERTRIPVPTSLRPDPVGGRGGANRWGGWGRSERSWGLDREVQEGGMSRSGDEARALGPPQGQLGKFTAVDIVVGDPSSSSDEESSGLGDGMHEVGAFADRDGPILAGEGSASGSRPGFGSETEVSFSGVMETPGTSEKESVSGCRSRDRGGGKWGTDMWSKGGGCRAKEASERAHVGTEGEGASPGKVFVGLCARLEALAKQALEEPSTSKGETWDEVGASTAEASEGQAQSSPAKTQLLALYNACGVRECLEAWREASRHKGTMSGGNVGRRARHCGGSAEATTRGIAGEEGSTEAGIKRMEQAAVDEAKSPPVVDGRKATAASLSTGRDAWTASSGGRGHRGWPALLLGTGAQRSRGAVPSTARGSLSSAAPSECEGTARGTTHVAQRLAGAVQQRPNMERPQPLQLSQLRRSVTSRLRADSNGRQRKGSSGPRHSHANMRTGEFVNPTRPPRAVTERERVERNGTREGGGCDAGLTERLDRIALELPFLAKLLSEGSGRPCR